MSLLLSLALGGAGAEEQGGRARNTRLSIVPPPGPVAAAVVVAAPSTGDGVYQFSVPLRNAKGEEIAAYLWVPPEADRLRGVLVGGQTLMEEAFARDVRIRAACVSERLAIVYFCPALDAMFEHESKGSDRLLQKALDDLGAISGYPELSAAPLFPFGHSVGSIFAARVAAWQPARCFGALAFKGGLPVADGESIAGVPILVVKGQFEEFGPGPSGVLRDFEDRETAWKGMREILAGLRQKDPRHLIAYLVEPGASHFAWSERLAPYAAAFIREAARRRIPDWPADAREPVQCLEVEPASGALTSIEVGREALAAPWGEFTGDRARTFWHLDPALAALADALHGDLFVRKPQFVTFADPTSGKPIMVGHDLRLRLTPHWVGPDTFRVAGTFLDRPPDKYPKVEGPVGHGTGPILFRAFAGAAEEIEPGTFRAGAGRCGRIRADILAFHPGDGVYRYAEQQGRVNLPDKLTDGKVQTISFPAVGPLAPGGAPVRLNASSDSGLPVRYYVESGPGAIDGNVLRVAEIPRKARFPLTIRVVAYQYGSGTAPFVRSAEPVTVTVEVAAATPDAAAGEFRRVEHPFLLWTKEEAAAIRRRVETEPWAKARYEEMLGEKGLGGTFRNLFRLVVMGDASAAEAEKKYLVSLIGNDPRKFLGDTGGGRHYDQYLSVLRYDALYDRLTERERTGLEATFRDFIRHHCDEETLRFTRTSWLPNMQWPRPMTAHLMAVALREEALIRKCFESRGGWKFYFDDYLADGRFYCEEFGKQYSMIGEMYLWCRGVERLGLDGLGFGYTGKGGATMRRFVESIVEIGYPRIDIPGGLPHYPQVTMGDARGSGFTGAPPYVFQKSIAVGRLAGGVGGNSAWMAANMNGRDHRNAKVDKMLHPHWFELAHAKWPDGKFDYFLAQMRQPGEKSYTPSLFWGIEPIDASAVKPPSAPSFVARERGFVLLRAEESPAYWEGPAPAAAFQLATYYVHYAHDVFSILGFYAFNRPIYLNRQISNGYGGSCPWTDSALGHCGVAVDRLQFALDEADPTRDHPHWPNPIGDVPLRSGFDDLVKFVAARARPIGGSVSLDNRQPLAVQTLSLELRRDEPEVWPGVDMTRALFLTREYLFDVFRLSSDRPRLWQWQVHALGHARADGAGWAQWKDLLEELYDLSNRQVAKRLDDPVERERYAIRDVRRLDAGDEGWFVDVVQTCALPEVETSVLGRAWYDRKVGVRVRMLGEPGTAVYAGKTPVGRTVPGLEGNKGEGSGLPNEVGGATVLVERKKPATVFTALHEPFEKGTAKIAEFRRIQETAEGIAAAVVGRPGSGVDDRILFSYDDAGKALVTLAGGGESFTFSDRAFVRIGKERVEVSGGLRALKVKVEGAPRLLVGGRERRALVKDGFLVLEGDAGR